MQPIAVPAPRFVPKSIDAVAECMLEGSGGNRAAGCDDEFGRCLQEGVRKAAGWIAGLINNFIDDVAVVKGKCDEKRDEYAGKVATCARNFRDDALACKDAAAACLDEFANDAQVCLDTFRNWLRQGSPSLGRAR